MQQTKRITINTIQKQQEDLLRKLYREKEDLKLALQDKDIQIKIQEQVLREIANGK